MLHGIVKFEKLLIDQCFVSLEVHTLIPEIMMFRLRGHGSGSTFYLSSFRSDPCRSCVDATDMDPIQSSADAKRGFLQRKENPCI